MLLKSDFTTENAENTEDYNYNDDNDPWRRGDGLGARRSARATATPLLDRHHERGS
jgi:hypothetical protein